LLIEINTSTHYLMIKSILFGLLCTLATSSLYAQVFSGLEEIDKAKKEGFFTYINSEEKYVIEAWKKYLKQAGSVENGRSGGTLHVYSAKIKDVSDKPVTLLSKVSEEKNKTKLFVSISTGPDAYIQTGHESFREASNWVEEFVRLINLEEDVRMEEKKLNELISNKSKQQKQADRFIRELDSNKRQAELLTKKLEEAKVEKEKILANQEQNRLDLKSNEDAILMQAQKLESAKQKIK
jgi:hypothetical protein